MKHFCVSICAYDQACCVQVCRKSYCAKLIGGYLVCTINYIFTHITGSDIITYTYSHLPLESLQTPFTVTMDTVTMGTAFV